MKMLINGCYGGFGISEEALEVIAKNNEALFKEFVERGVYDTACNEWYNYKLDCTEIRTNQILISELESLIENDFPVDRSSSCIEIVEIPDNATDWRLIDYDGVETLYYVVDGKIKAV